MMIRRRIRRRFIWGRRRFPALAIVAFVAIGVAVGRFLSR